MYLNDDLKRLFAWSSNTNLPQASLGLNYTFNLFYQV